MMKKFAKAIAWILIVVLLAGGIYAIWFLTDGGNENFKSFTLSHDGKMIAGTKSKMELELGSTPRFDVNYILDGPNAEPRDYSVKIVPNGDYAFDYTVNGEPDVWKGNLDLSWAFRLEKNDTYFTFQIPSDFGIEAVLKRTYGGSKVAITSEVDESKPLYALVVSSYNNAVTYQIAFSINANKGEQYSITYAAEFFDGEPTWVYFTCQEKAYAGETVNLSIRPASSATEHISAVYLHRESAEDVLITPNGHVYSESYTFVMPAEDVTIRILVYNVLRGAT